MVETQPDTPHLTCRHRKQYHVPIVLLQKTDNAGDITPFHDQDPQHRQCQFGRLGPNHRRRVQKVRFVLSVRVRGWEVRVSVLPGARTGRRTGADAQHGRLCACGCACGRGCGWACGCVCVRVRACACACACTRHQGACGDGRVLCSGSCPRFPIKKILFTLLI